MGRGGRRQKTGAGPLKQGVSGSQGRQRAPDRDLGVQRVPGAGQGVPGPWSGALGPGVQGVLLKGRLGGQGWAPGGRSGHLGPRTGGLAGGPGAGFEPKWRFGAILASKHTEKGCHYGVFLVPKNTCFQSGPYVPALTFGGGAKKWYKNLGNPYVSSV